MDAGLITAEQARAIESAEATAAAEAEQHAPSAPSRVPIAVEALGYVGGALAIVAGLIAVWQIFGSFTEGTGRALTVIGWIGFLGAGAALRAEADPAFARLRSVLWVLSTACVAVFVGLLLLIGDDPDGRSLSLAMAACALVQAAVLHRRSPSGLLQVAVFASAAWSVTSLLSRLGDIDDGEALGLVVWAFSVLWFALAGRWWATRPATAATVAAAVGGLAGAQAVMSDDAGDVLGVVTLVAIVGAGIVSRRLLLVVVGAAGVVQVVPQVATDLLPDDVAAPAAVFLVGVALICLAVWLARRRPRAGSAQPSSSAA